MTTPTVAAPIPAPPPAVSTSPSRPAAPTRRRFTVAEYYAMAEAGILAHDERVELLDGDVIVMPPIGDPHAYSVDEIAEDLTLAHQGRARVRTQNPLRLDDHSVPEPDVMLLRRRDDLYRSSTPRPEDVLLLIEVSDSTLNYDLREKLPRYARAGIPEVWIANRRGRRIEAYTAPSGDEYTGVRYVGPGESIAPQAFPDIMLEVDWIIPAEAD